MSARALPGKRVDSYRAGMTTMLVSCAECSRDGTGSTLNHSIPVLLMMAPLASTEVRGSPPRAPASWRVLPQPASMAGVACENVLVALAAAMGIAALGACRAEVSSATSAAPATTQPRKPPAAGVEQVRDWTLPKRPAPPTRNRNPFKYGDSVPGVPNDSPIAPGVSPDAFPDRPPPIPASDLRLIGIVGSDDDHGFTAVVTVGNELVLAREGDTIAERYRVIRVGEDSLDVIDGLGNQPRH